MQDKLERELARAIRENATGYLASQEFIPFCEFSVSQGYGISRVEAYASRHAGVPPNVGYEILGLDGEDNWEEHFDLQRSLALAREVYGYAKEDGAELTYRVWIGKPRVNDLNNC